MSQIPSYASQFKFLVLTFPFPKVLHVELARPKVNAFHEEFWREYGAAFDRIAQDSSVRVIVLSSRMQKAFSAGVDLAQLGSKQVSPDTARSGLLLRTLVQEFQHAISAPSRAPQPVIVAIHGIAFGLALDAIAACDIRWAAEDGTSFSIRETDVGLAADIGTLARFPKLVGNLSLFQELALSARLFGADEALKVGIVSKVVPGSREEVIQAALDFARIIAEKSPVALTGVKRFIAHAIDNPVDDALQYQATWAAAAVQGTDLVNSAQAVIKKQKITYENLGELNRVKINAKL
ncbi:ClpP/crotonase [Multifurca ochricompacta]|uniref:ClpP/crotonase n=1 Tax=Multifurca ochricompacta TaxID=376703 RepID=A0AAD4M1V9_9AGAM|nr:ClpP/crotonase [Multifurca ochricompacta]